MKQVIIKDVKLSYSINEDLLSLTETQINTIVNNILHMEFNNFSKKDLQVFQTQRATLVVSDTSIMTAEMYAGLLGYFYNEKAFSEEEKGCFLYPIFDRELTQRELYIAADELITFKAKEFLPTLREIIKDTVVAKMTDATLIASVRLALLDAINKL
ncbi:MAG: hypothetical protein J6X03_02685 [Bacilli bacterium]|nr:hypothetical protein [Bacilli bacterium]